MIATNPPEELSPAFTCSYRARPRRLVCLLIFAGSANTFAGLRLPPGIMTEAATRKAAGGAKLGFFLLSQLEWICPSGNCPAFESAAKPHMNFFSSFIPCCLSSSTSLPTEVGHEARPTRVPKAGRTGTDLAAWRAQQEPDLTRSHGVPPTKKDRPS